MSVSHISHIRRAVAGCAAALVVLSACGSDSDTAGGSGGGMTCHEADKPVEGDAYEGDDTAAAIEERGKPTDIWAPSEPATELAIVDVVPGTGDEVTAESTVEIQYTGISQDDCEEFDSSWESPSPATFGMSGVIEGFSKGLLGMKPGGRRHIVMPSSMAYGDEAIDDPNAPPTGTLVFVVDLLSISDTPAATPPPAGPDVDPAALAAVTERGKPEMVVPDPLPTELTIIDDIVGEGAEVPEGGTVVAHYVGVDATGTQFDASWDRGEPATFGLAQVIPGWTEGLVGMRVGGRRTLIIPADMAYGDDASRGGPTGTLVFTIDLVGAA